MKKYFSVLGALAVMTILAGCSSVRGNVGTMPIYKFPSEEAAWIRNGESLIFEEEEWIPQDGFDIFLDSEVYRVGEYRGVQVFVDKGDVRPYEWVYSKFDNNKFRVFKKKITNDKNK